MRVLQACLKAFCVVPVGQTTKRLSLPGAPVLGGASADKRTTCSRVCPVVLAMAAALSGTGADKRWACSLACPARLAPLFLTAALRHDTFKP